MYVIYNKETTYYIEREYSKHHCFKREREAKAALTRAEKKHKDFDRSRYAIATVGDFLDNIEKEVERTNLMSGKKYMERVNTPHYCSPASEAYWQM